MEKREPSCTVGRNINWSSHNENSIKFPQKNKNRTAMKWQLLAQSCLTMWPHRLEPSRLLCPWGFPGKNTGVFSHFLLQGIFLTQRWNPALPYCRQSLYHLSQQESPELPSVQFSCSVVSDSLRPRGLQHARLLYPSPTPRACSNSCPLCRWCHMIQQSHLSVFFWRKQKQCFFQNINLKK